MEEMICLGPNYPNFKNDCKEQCESCRNFQNEIKNPKKVSEEEMKQINDNYNKMISISNL